MFIMATIDSKPWQPVRVVLIIDVQGNLTTVTENSNFSLLEQEARGVVRTP